MIETEPILTVAPPGLALRRMLDSDLPFLEALYASTRQDELAPVPWSAEQKRAFLRSQFACQHQYYQQYYPHCEFLIVERTGVDSVERLGRLYVDRWPDQIRLVDISLMPEFRGRGTGRRLIEGILAEGQSTGKRVTIHVEHDNPARRLYGRVGFRHVDSNGIYHLMEWGPGAPTER
jgi:ribosomal protein S18 acetylase RimI-like enzyme